MENNILHPELTLLCDSLDALAQKVTGASSENRLLSDAFGWNFIAVDRQSLGRAASDLARGIRCRGSEVLDESTVTVVKRANASVQRLAGGFVQHLFNGNGQQAVPVYLETLLRIREDLQQILGWQGIRDTNLLPPKLARRLRSYQAQLDEIAPNAAELKRQIELISEATGAAESLPTDLAALSDARTKVEKFESSAASLHQKIDLLSAESEVALKTISERAKEADVLVSRCEEAYRITTTRGLAAAFEQRAHALGTSMWVWVFGLILALTAGYLLGAQRLKALADVLNSTAAQKATIWPNAILAFVSLAAPVWFAWLATKQIGQRFRLAEDYGFKASVAKAYEGYRKEAVRIDKQFEARLFSAALTRLEEAPLRLVEAQTPGSPWHEFVESEAFREALRSLPAFAEQFKKLTGKALVAGAAQADKAAKP
ncbi:MAG: hypothetical protein ABSF95_04870 [Verrucomicrobiota bacterium]|jgi:hypothetical protein